MSYVMSTTLAHAIPMETTLNDVVIGSQIYDVSFSQHSTFNDVFGTGSPTLTFTTLPEAYYAANAVLDAICVAGVYPCFDYYPAYDRGAPGFSLPFSFTPMHFTFLLAGYSDDTTGYQRIFGPYTQVRSDDPYIPISTFSQQTAVPEPSTLALLSLGLAGLGITRRLRKA